MKATTPKEMQADLCKIDLEDALTAFEEQLVKFDKGFSAYGLSIDGVLRPEDCLRIEKLYVDAGWSTAICTTSVEGKVSFLNIQYIPGLIKRQDDEVVESNTDDKCS
jgi:hypothetical protein